MPQFALGHLPITFCRLHKSESFGDWVQPFFYYEALGGYNYMQFLGKTIWVCKLPREVAFFIWIFFDNLRKREMHFVGGNFSSLFYLNGIEWICFSSYDMVLLIFVQKGLIKKNIFSEGIVIVACLWMTKFSLASFSFGSLFA